jgi:hypothetical protein
MYRIMMYSIINTFLGDRVVSMYRATQIVLRRINYLCPKFSA